ncbi:hypothetical protein D3C72_2039790 [compost metagenome]
MPMAAAMFSREAPSKPNCAKWFSASVRMPCSLSRRDAVGALAAVSAAGARGACGRRRAGAAGGCRASVIAPLCVNVAGERLAWGLL